MRKNWEQMRETGAKWGKIGRNWKNRENLRQFGEKWGKIRTKSGQNEEKGGETGKNGGDALKMAATPTKWPPP